MNRPTDHLLQRQLTGQYNRQGDAAYRAYQEDRSLIPYFLILFIISPVLALISAAATFKQRGAKLAMILFIGAYGYTFILNPGMDSYRLSLDFKEYYQFLSPHDFWTDLWSIITLSGSGSTADEPYMAIISYFMAQFTDSTSWFFLLIGLILGIFYVWSISLVYENRSQKWNAAALILFVFFISWIGIYGLNAPRSYTGGFVFFCGAYQYIKTNNYKYLLLVLMAPMIHFGYAGITFPFFVYVFAGNLKYVYITALAVSFIASVGLNLFEPVLTATELGQQKAEIYTGERWEARGGGSFQQESSFHAKYYQLAGRRSIEIIFIGSILFLGYLSGKHHDRIQTALGSVAILMLSFSNFTEIIPALSHRTFNNFGLFALAYLVRLYSLEENRIRNFHWLVYICLPAILLFLFTQYSRIGDYMDFKVFVSPLFYPFLGEDPVSIKEFLRSILDL